MVIDMNESKLATLEQIREFLARTYDVAFAIPAEEPRRACPPRSAASSARPTVYTLPKLVREPR
jgi:hypothetical protein